MIFYHFTTLMLPQGSEKGGRVYSKCLSGVSFCAVGSFEISVQNGNSFYYARLSTIKNVQSGLDEVGSFGLSSQYYVLNN